ncbi:unnamed protein product, partial [Coregonus sp. 'balchen']
VYIRIVDNEWNVYRRYTEFRALHNHLRSQFPQVDTFNFPPKKAIGNKTLPEFSAKPTKETLLQLLPFCLKTAQSRSSSSFPILGRSHNQEGRNLEPQSGDL